MLENIVAKFGGSSIALAEHVDRIRRIIEDDNRRRFIVVSAPGKRDKNDTKVTDLLIKLSEYRDPSLRDEIYRRFHKIYDAHGLREDTDEVLTILDKRLDSNREIVNEAYQASIASFGEYANARLLAKALNATYIDPKELFLVEGNFVAANWVPGSERIAEKFADRSGLFVIPGYFGYDSDGLLKVFDRGGSDISGAIAASGVDAIVYENFTDKKGVFAANPKIVDNPYLNKEMTYGEMRDLAYMGGLEVFHRTAMMPVERKGIPIHIRGTDSYPEEGTYVRPVRFVEPKRPIAGVTYQNGFYAFKIEETGLNERLGILYEIAKVFRDSNISIEFPISGIDNLEIVVRQNEIQKAGKSAELELIKKLKDILGATAQVSYCSNLGAVVVSGEGLGNNPQLPAQIELSLVKEGINIEFQSRAGKRSVVYGVMDYDGENAVKLIHNKFIANLCTIL